MSTGFELPGDLRGGRSTVRMRLVTFLNELEETLDSIEDPDGGERSNIEHVADDHSSTSNA